jgi:hypothetical protein
VHTRCPNSSPPPRARATRAPTTDSVAVLYFDNLLRDTANSYLADVLTEELIVRLSQMRACGGSRAAERLAGPDLDRREVWANIYDRSGADILQIQSDIATEATRAITGQLLPVERTFLARKPTNDSVAYDFYLRGVGAANTLSEPGLRAGLALFDRAIARDSNFAEAWAQEAVVWLMVSDSWVEGREGYRKVRAAAELAIRVDSAQALAWSMLVFPAVVLDFDSAFVWLDRARERRTHWLIALSWDPMLTPLHSDPRFAALLCSVGRAPM